MSEQDPAAEEGVSEGVADGGGPRRSPLNLILAVALIVLLVGVGVAVFFVVQVATTSHQPQTMTDLQVQQLQQQIKKTPQNGTLYLQLASEFYNVQAYDKALQALKDLQSINPTGATLAESIYAQGRITEVRGDKNAALDDYLKSVSVTETAEARWALGNLYLDQKKYVDAAKDFEHYVVLVPGDAGGFAKLGAAYEGAADTQKALAAYRKSNAFIPNQPAVVAAIKRLEGKKQ